MDLELIRVEPRQAAMTLVLDTLDSPNSRSAYRVALSRFFDWWDGMGNRLPFTKILVNEYRSYLLGLDLAPATINLALSAVRKLALEAGDNGYLDANVAAAIGRVPGVKVRGKRLGNWLTREQAVELLSRPDTTTLVGLRDRAILAVMLGGGLRRAEVCSLAFKHFQQRDGRWVIVNLVGKGLKVRSVPIPGWAKAAIDEWVEAAGLESGHVFRRLTKGGYVGGPLTTRGLHYIIKEKYGVCPHDLRRTFARLAYKNGRGADLEQIRLSLGHSSVKTTEIYLGAAQDFESAPCDHIELF